MKLIIKTIENLRGNLVQIFNVRDEGIGVPCGLGLMSLS